MGNWLKGAALASILILPGCTRDAERGWCEGMPYIVIGLGGWWFLRRRPFDFTAQQIADRDADIGEENKLIDALEDAITNAKVAGDEGHASNLVREVAEARERIARWKREKREIASGLDPKRNDGGW